MKDRSPSYSSLNRSKISVTPPKTIRIYGNQNKLNMSQNQDQQKSGEKFYQQQKSVRVPKLLQKSQIINREEMQKDISPQTERPQYYFRQTKGILKNSSQDLLSRTAYIDGAQKHIHKEKKVLKNLQFNQKRSKTNNSLYESTNDLIYQSHQAEQKSNNNINNNKTLNLTFNQQQNKNNLQNTNYSSHHTHNKSQINSKPTKNYLNKSTRNFHTSGHHQNNRLLNGEDEIYLKQINGGFQTHSFNSKNEEQNQKNNNNLSNRSFSNKIKNQLISNNQQMQYFSKAFKEIKLKKKNNQDKWIQDLDHNLFNQNPSLLNQQKIDEQYKMLKQQTLEDMRFVNDEYSFIQREHEQMLKDKQVLQQKILFMQKDIADESCYIEKLKLAFTHWHTQIDNMEKNAQKKISRVVLEKKEKERLKSECINFDMDVQGLIQENKKMVIDISNFRRENEIFHSEIQNQKNQFNQEQKQRTQLLNSVNQHHNQLNKTQNKFLEINFNQKQYLGSVKNIINHGTQQTSSPQKQSRQNQSHYLNI